MVFHFKPGFIGINNSWSFLYIIILKMLSMMHAIQFNIAAAAFYNIDRAALHINKFMQRVYNSVIY